jgi:hypothetical protein
MNQDIRDALARLTHALENEARQASLPTDAPSLQTANDLLRLRLEEEIAIAANERKRADAAEREAEYWRKEIRAVRNAAATSMEDALDLMRPAVVLEQERNDLRIKLAAQRAQLDDAHNALTAAGIPLEPHEPHEGCATQLGHRVRLLAAREGGR